MRKRCLAYMLISSLCMSGCNASNLSIQSEHTDHITETKTSSKNSTPDQDSAKTDALASVQKSIYGITITELNDTPVFYAKDDPSVPVLEISVSYPNINIKDNADASDKINAVIEAERDTFLEFEKETASYAQEAYDTALDSSDETFETYTANFSYQLKRCDDKIISVVFCQSDYSGGAHSNYLSYGMTFDTLTGERLYLESLSKNNTAFHQMLLDELNEQAALPAYQNYLFGDSSSDIECSLLENSESWYFDRSGISFISNPYVLGPYAAGTFEFNIPYENLTGLKNKYCYNDSYIRKLFPGTPAQYDINGDNITDEVCYSIASEADFTNATPLLIINNNDLSSELSKLYLSDLWTGAYYLIDINSEDTFIEIAISDKNAKNPNNSRTHFFRYDTQNHLTYLGNIPGIFNEDMQIRYNANGNLVLCDRNGEVV